MSAPQAKGYVVELLMFTTWVQPQEWRHLEARKGVVRVFATEAGAIRAARALMHRRPDLYGQPARIRRFPDGALVSEIYIDGGHE